MAMPNVTESIDQTPEVACIPTTPPAKIPGTDTNALPGNVILLQEEMSRATGYLLAIRLSLDARQWKQVSDFKMALHQNEAEAMEAIREAKAHCGVIVREADACCSAEIREAESCCAEHAHSIQQLHAEGYATSGNRSHGGGRERLPLFFNCLWNGIVDLPPEAHGVLMAPSIFSWGTCLWPPF